MQTITLIGSGLSGSLLALYLAKQNYKVHVYEKRPDIRKAKAERGRSINLAISRRGVYALEKIGIADHIMAKSTPMYARMIHDVHGNCERQVYGRNQEEYISALSREDLNTDLLNFMDQEKNIETEFNCQVTDIDIESGQLTIFNTVKKTTDVTPPADIVIATDGAPSAVRQAIMSKGVANFSTEFLSHGYKELVLNSEFGKSFEKNSLHIWPRGNFMLIALPNLDGSFTCTLFLAMKGEENSFEHLKSKPQITAFFKKYFSDIESLIPDLADQFLSNPIGELGTLRGSPWYYKDKILLLGDAAHAIVPFFGQGMNCAFEDCTVFDELLSKNKNDWGWLFSEFFTLRKQNADAIAQMAIDNFLEMSSDTGRKEFLLHKEVEKEIMSRYGDKYVSRYVMISFTREPYKFAQTCGRLQKDFLEKICKSIANVKDLDWHFVENELDLYLAAVEKEKASYGLL
jgi:kynurenine 3-monooxygenase